MEGGVVRYNLSSLVTLATLEGDASDHILRGENAVDDGDMFGQLWAFETFPWVGIHG